jgi:hypothetical protein
MCGSPQLRSHNPQRQFHVCAAGMTRFYLLELAGRKLVRMIPPSELYRTDSPDLELFQPMIFGIDLFDPDFQAHPRLDGMLIYEALLEAGDVLYVPEGWAHQALNLEWTLMSSTNYIDQHDMRAVQSLLHFNGVCTRCCVSMCIAKPGT